MSQRLVLASNNPGKLREFADLLKPFAIDVIAQGSLDIPAADEPYNSFVENALAKARHASQRSSLPALADDSGICVDALGGAPGVRSARFAGEHCSDEDNNQKLIASLQGQQNRRATMSVHWCSCATPQMQNRSLLKPAGMVKSLIRPVVLMALVTTPIFTSLNLAKQLLN